MRSIALLALSLVIPFSSAVANGDTDDREERARKNAGRIADRVLEREDDVILSSDALTQPSAEELQRLSALAKRLIDLKMEPNGAGTPENYRMEFELGACAIDRKLNVGRASEIRRRCGAAKSEVRFVKFITMTSSKGQLLLEAVELRGDRTFVFDMKGDFKRVPPPTVSSPEVMLRDLIDFWTNVAPESITAPDVAEVPYR